MRTPSAEPATTGASAVERRTDDDHPPVALVAREGDPFSAVAVAIAHDRGARLSAAFAALLLQRLSGTPAIASEARPSGTGVVLVARVDTPRDAAGFVSSIAHALEREVSPAEATRALEQAARTATVRGFRSPAEEAVGSCVGELGATATSRLPTAADLEELRRAVYGTRAISFGAVGHRALLEESSRALLATDAWPAHEGPTDPWPPGDVLGTAPAPGGSRTLSVAVRTADAARAIEVAQELGSHGSELAAQVAQMEPAWTMERAVGVVRPRGGCVRFDLHQTTGSASPKAAARAAALVADEVTLALGRRAGEPFSLDRGVLEADDPRDAAAVAAWRSLSSQERGGPMRVFAEYATSSPDSGSDSTFAQAMEMDRRAARVPSVDVASVAEPGQGQLWLLLANPCGAPSEGPEDGGANAVLVKMIARATPSVGGVSIEPWISGEGTGLLAHGPRLGADEPSADHARRIATALGRAIAGSPVEDAVAGAARAEAEAEIASDVPALWTAGLLALSPDHPSLLEPRGTWQSLTNLSTQAIETRRRAFLRGPLRMAMLTGGGTADANTAERSLARWLRPLRERKATCPAHGPLGTRPGEYVVDSPSGMVGSRALVGVTLPASPETGIPPEAGMTAHLLNRPDGWLDRALRVPGIATHAVASVVGGSLGAALVVEIALPDTNAKAAISQVRALLQRLSQGAATPEDVRAATTALLAQRTAAMLDPRHRVVRLWLGQKDDRAPDLAALHEFHRRTLDADRHVVVMTRPR